MERFAPSATSILTRPEREMPDASPTTAFVPERTSRLKPALLTNGPKPALEYSTSSVESFIATVRERFSVAQCGFSVIFKVAWSSAKSGTSLRPSRTPPTFTVCKTSVALETGMVRSVEKMPPSRQRMVFSPPSVKLNVETSRTFPVLSKSSVAPLPVTVIVVRLVKRGPKYRSLSPESRSVPPASAKERPPPATPPGAENASVGALTTSFLKALTFPAPETVISSAPSSGLSVSVVARRGSVASTAPVRVISFLIASLSVASETSGSPIMLAMT